MKKRSQFKHRLTVIGGLLIFTALSIAAAARTHRIDLFETLTAGLLRTNPTPTPTPPQRKQKPKRLSERLRQASRLVGNSPEENSLLAPLATTEFNLIGLVGTVAPATQTVPKNIATAVNTSIQIPDGEDPAPILAGLNPNYRIRGELVGPSLTSPLTIEAPLGSALPIPALQNVGDHLLQNLRVVDVTDATGSTIAPVVPDACGITVIERVLVTQVQVNQLTYEQIVQAGINLNSSNYNFYNFTIGLGTTSGNVPIQIPVALPTAGGQPPVVGMPQSPTGVNGVSIPDIVPVMLEIDQNEDGEPDGNVELPGGQPMQIPGVVVFPGRVGLLHQFFEAIVIVANGAPNGTPLVITNLRAKAKLPDAGTPNNPNDDPLRIAQTQQGGIVSELDIHGLGPDGRYGTADDTASFNPGQSGQATFLLEGLREGLHTVDFDLQGTLNGLPVGPVNIVGSVPGAVLVRDARFGVTFTHPSVVRAGQEYDLGVTVFNSGATSINGITLNLGSNSVSGATLLDTPEKTITQTIPRGGSATIKWHLRSNTTGAVTASYVKIGEGIEGGLRLITGVGDRNVPLSPDSLILPEPVRHLPADVVEAGRQMLGQAWSVANAPGGTLPPGVFAIDKQTVVSKAVEMGWAGLRADFGEESDLTLQTLLRDWLGENQTGSNTGFADALRNTPAGYYFFDVLGNRFYESLQTATASDFHRKLINSEAGRSPFVSALIAQNAGNSVFKAKLNSPNGQSVGWNATERFGDLRTAASLDLLEDDPHNSANNSRGKLLVASKPVSGNWNLELFGMADGMADVSILTPTVGKNYRQLIFSGLSFSNGKRYRITFKNSGTATPIAEEFVNGNYQPVTLSFTSSEINEPSPEVVSAVQVTPEVIEGGDRFGRLVGVLYSKPMTKSSVETLNRYAIGGGELASDTSQIIGKNIKVTGATQNFGARFSILALDAPVGPFINRNLTVNGAVDTSGKSILGATKNIEMRVSPQGNPPGGYVTGRVMNADGNGVSNAKVFYQTDGNSLATIGYCGTAVNLTTVAAKNVDVNGDFVIDYVIDGICTPVTLLATNPAVNATKVVTSNVAYNGQHITLNAVFLARGNVQGTVSNNGIPIVNASVSVIPELDVLNVKNVRTDSQGRYSVTGIPVGGFTVKAVGDGIYSLASGIAAGSLNQGGQTVTVNVSTQDISGSVKGKVFDFDGGGQTPIPNSLVVAYASIAGFPGNEMTPVGYAFTTQDGSFTITGLPITNIFLSAVDPQRGISASTNVVLTPQNKQAEGIVLQVSNGFGRVLGRVLNELSQPIPNAYVQEGSQTVRADSAGNYVLPRVREGNVSLTGVDPLTGQRGSATISVRRNEDTIGADIVIRRPANLNGQVFISENGTTQPLAQAYVTVDGRSIVQTDAQGRYSLTAVASGNQTIRFVYPARRQVVNTSVFLNPGETLTRNATFRPSKIHGRITQPDGVTPAVATVNLSTLVPNLGQNLLFGLAATGNLAIQSNADGEFSINNLNPGLFRVTASNSFFPTPVSKSGNLPPNTDLEVNLSLVETLTGKIHGHIYQPDGVTPVGEGVIVNLGNGSLGDASVQTNAQGYFEFADVFSEGNYDLTATDPLSGKSNRKSIYVLKNQDVTVDMRLLGKGKLKVKVVDANNNPVSGGTLTVTGNTYPNNERFIELNPVFNGEYLFTELAEGNYSVAAQYNGLGGRVSANVTLGGTTEVVVQIEAVGTITGKIYMPDGTVPVGLADVSLSQNGRTVGFTTSDDSEEDRGKFVFQGVRTGSFVIDVFDNRTARHGRAFGQLTQQGQVVTADVRLLALGTVTGIVSSNGIPVEHALVNLQNGISRRSATTDSDGRYKFTGVSAGEVNISVTNGPGGLTGYATGFVTGTTEPLPDTILDVALTPTAAFTGTIYKFGGTAVYSGATVSIKSGTFQIDTTTDQNGKYRFDYIPLGNYEITAAAPFGFDRGRSQIITSDQPGATITTDVTMTGVGNISGLALDSNGSPLTSGKVEFTNSAWGEPLKIEVPVQANGSFSLLEMPTGDFNLKLTVPNLVGVGTVNGSLSGNQTINLNLQLEPAGKVFGVLKAIDGTTPVAGGDAVLKLTKQNGSEFNFVTRTDTEGNWEFSNIPLGNITISFTDSNSEGFARVSGLVLSQNAQEINAGTVVLSNSNFTVESINPPDGAINVPTGSNIVIRFSEPVDPSTVYSSSVRVLDNFPVSSTLSVSADGKTVTIDPNSLRQTVNYTVEVANSVKNQNGAPLQSPFVSTFRTADETAPYVTSVSPVFNSNQNPLNSLVSVTFDEPLGDNQEFSEIIRVMPTTPAGAPISGEFEITADRRTVNFTPSALSGNTRYQIAVFGQKDAAGNVQNTVYLSNFSTIDTIAPIIADFKIDNKALSNDLIVTNATPQFLANFSDNLAVNRLETKLYLAKAGQPLQAVSIAQTVNLLNYIPPQPLTAGQYKTKLVVKDAAGNETATPEFTFTMDPQMPDILNVIPNAGVMSGNSVVTIEGRNLVTQSIEPDENARGLSGVYQTVYSGRERISRIDDEINFDLQQDSFTPYLPNGNAVGVVWKGKIIPRFSEEYTLTSQNSGGIKLTINGQTVIDYVQTENVEEHSGTISLVAGQAYEIVVEHFPIFGETGGNYGRNHVVKLFWSSASQTREIVPREQLRPAAQQVYPTILIGGQPATVLGAGKVNEFEPTQLVTFLTPPGNEGVASVEVQNSNGSDLESNGFTYVFDEYPPQAVNFSIHENSPGRINIYFDEPLSPDQNFANVLQVHNMTNGETQVAGALTLDETGRKLTFIPNVPFIENVVFRVTVVNQEDVVGNTAVNPETRFFSIDRTAPEIYEITPDGTNVENPNPKIRVSYRDGLSPIISGQLTVDGIDRSNQLSFYNNNNITYFEYQVFPSLEAGLHTYTARVIDEDGNIAERNGSFTIVSDTNPPFINYFKIADKNAVDGLRINQRNPFIVVNFLDNGGDLPYQQKLYFGPQGGQLALVRNSAGRDQDGYVLDYFVPQQDYGFYTVRAELTDAVGNTLIKSIDFEITQEQIDVPQAYVISANPNGQYQTAPESLITLNFSSPISPNQNFGELFKVYDYDLQNGQTLQVTGNYVLNAEGKSLTFTPETPFAVNKFYYYSIENYLDPTGQVGQYFSSYFATTDTLAPTLNSLKLRTDDETIDLDNAQTTESLPNIEGRFTDNLMGVDSNTLNLTLDGTTLQVNAQGENFTFVPGSPLAVGSHVITLQVADYAGNSSQIYTANFQVLEAPPTALRMPFAVESDTVLLWHLDDLSYDGSTTDSSSYLIHSVPNSSTANSVTGRFAGGAENPKLLAKNDAGNLAFSNNGFTVEAWLKFKYDVNNPPTAPFTIWSRSIGSQRDFSLVLQTNGDIQARVYNATGVVWETILPKTVFDLGDNKWHSVAMVVERGGVESQNQLKIYADGEMRIGAQAPIGFGAVRNSGGRFRFAADNSPFNFRADEIRISKTAHTAEQIRRNYNPSEMGLTALRSLPAVIGRGTATEVTVEGYNLENVSAVITNTDGSLNGAVVSVSNQTANSVQLNIAVEESAQLGDVVLNLTSAAQTVTLPLRIVDQKPFTAETGTVLLWHSDETNYGNVADAGPFAISGQSYGEIVSGRFGNAKGSLIYTAPNLPQLNFGNNSFTVEGWFKGKILPYSNGSLNIFSKGNSNNNSEVYSLQMLDNGRLRARVYDTVQRVWETSTLPGQIAVADNRWHYVAMVVQRGSQPSENRLSIFVDGVEKSVAQIPAQFSDLRTTGGEFIAGNNDGFSIDEVRVSSFARSSIQILADWNGGTTNFAQTRLEKPGVKPKAEQKSSPSERQFGGKTVAEKQTAMPMRSISAINNR
ncbi:MAG TPA: Ig-like domain-containing protein [Pyrinomonadaceae bacterium]|nr:Ig-like domain-containing protein [Pyrinomonadaceae bacterium]